MPNESASTRLPVPGHDDIAHLLQAVWDALDEAERWPTFGAIDRAFYREYRVDAAELIARTSTVFLHGGRAQGGAAPAPNGELALTVAGAAACSGAEQVLLVVVAAARLAAEAYLSDDPAEPAVTFDQVLAELGADLPDDRQRDLARRSGLLLVQEPWRTHTSLTDGGWRIQVDRGIRPYAGVETLDQYWQARQQQLVAQQGPITGQIWSGASHSGEPIDAPPTTTDDQPASMAPSTPQTDPSAATALQVGDAPPEQPDRPAESIPRAPEATSSQGSHPLLVFLGLVLGLFVVLPTVIQATNAVWAQITGLILVLLMMFTVFLCWLTWNRLRLRNAGLVIAVLLALSVAVVLIVGNAA